MMRVEGVEELEVEFGDFWETAKLSGGIFFEPPVTRREKNVQLVTKII